MLKLDREIESTKCQSCRRIFFICISVVIPSLFMKEEDDPLLMESGLLIFKMEGRQALHLRVNRFSFLITKSSESSASRIV